MCVKVVAWEPMVRTAQPPGGDSIPASSGLISTGRGEIRGFLGARNASLQNNPGDYEMNDEVVIGSTGRRAEREYEWETVESVGMLVVETVAEVSETPHLELEQLYTRVDTDALDNLFRPVVDGPSRTGGKVEFPFDDYFVSVHADGRIVVEQVREE